MAERKAALVTGSTSGIGLGIAAAFAKAGMDVMLNGFGDPAAIEQERSSLEKATGVTVKYDGADLTKPDACAQLVGNVEAAFGKLDVIVNNAGVQFVAPIEDFPVEKWDLIISLNLSASFHIVRAAMRGMKAREIGRASCRERV